MKIGIVGSGNIGTAVGTLLAQAGHELHFSFSRDADKPARVAAEIGERAHYGTPEGAVTFGDVILFTPPYGVLDEALRQTGSLAGKIVIDTMNPFTMRGVELASGGTAAEVLAERQPEARVVKAYNHLAAAVIRNQAHAADPIVAFVSGDDAEAKQIVTGLVTDSGFRVMDLGALHTARHTEPHGTLFNKPMTEAQARAAVATL